MSLTKDRLKQIIKEELSSLLSEETDLEAEASAAFEDLVANGYKGLPEREMYIKNYIDLRTGDNPLRPKLAQRRATFTRIDDPLEMSKALLPLAETRPTFNLRVGDFVRHRDEAWLGLGRVLAKANKRHRVILVDWEAGFTRRHDPSSLVKSER